MLFMYGNIQFLLLVQIYRVNLIISMTPCQIEIKPDHCMRAIGYMLSIIQRIEQATDRVDSNNGISRSAAPRFDIKTTFLGIVICIM